MESSANYHRPHITTAYAVAPQQRQPQQQLPRQPVQQTSILNLRTLFQLLSDEEFESEVEMERTRRASARRKKPHDNSNNNNNNKKRAPPASSSASIDSRKKPKKNSVFNVTLPVAAARAATKVTAPPPPSPPSPPRSPLQPTIGFALQPVAAATALRPESTKRQGWDEQYNALVQFKAEHGKVNSKKEDSSLYWWVASQRTAWRKFLKGDASSTLTQTQVDRLIDIGLGTRHEGPTNFANNNYAAAWETQFQELVKFHAEFGHTEVRRDPHRDRFYKLAFWVEVQRANYNHRQHQATTGTRKPNKWGIMTDEQLEKLSTLSFRFTTASRPEFDTRLDQLIEYQRKFGNTRVPEWYSSPTGPANLGNWVQYLRKQYRLQLLDPVRVAMLEGIGMVWKVREDGIVDDGGGCTKNKNHENDKSPST